MDLRLLLIFLLPLLSLQIRVQGEGSGSIFFLDAPSHQFLRTYSSDGVTETSSMSLSDAGAAVSILLGFSPPAFLSAESSSKLNEVLAPNPFNRPRAVLMLEVGGFEDQQLLMDHLGSAQIHSVIRSKVLVESAKAEIQLPGNDEISMLALDEFSSLECDAVCADKQLQDLASWLGGSYVINAEEPLNGKLTVKLATGKSLSLHISKKTDGYFIMSVLSFVRNIRRAMEVHEDSSRSISSPAELVIGSFSGLKQQEQSEEKLELFLVILSKLFDSLQEAYQGEIVGVIYFNVKPEVEFGSTSNVKLVHRPSSRMLGEEENVKLSPIEIKIAEVVLVRRTLAWITGIILLLSTLLGIYFLVNMPLTRDTLLYSNVKLD